MPSQELLDKWNKREGDLIKANEGCCPEVALPPTAKGAYVGQELPDKVREKIYKEGARTIPGREHGGNVDIKNLSRGSRCYFPVYVDGANLAVGDLHFSQGDGELSFCGAIEMVSCRLESVQLTPGRHCHSEDLRHQGRSQEARPPPAHLPPLAGRPEVPRADHFPG